MRAGAVATINKKVVGTMFTKFSSAILSIKFHSWSQARAVTKIFTLVWQKWKANKFIPTYMVTCLGKNKSLHQLLKRYYVDSLRKCTLYLLAIVMHIDKTEL